LDFRHSGVDLHIHSTASDGTLSPVEILRLAESLNLGAISITDHDTLKGSEELFEIAGSSDIHIVTGIEISATASPALAFKGSFHILGYGIRLDDSVLNQQLDILQQARKNRNPLIIDKLNAMGVDISLNEVIKISREALLGRPHIAQVMVYKGIVKTIDEAFNVYLGTNRPAYVDKYRLDCQKAIEMIRGAGGIPVMAHPYLLNIPDNPSLDTFVSQLSEMGLQGIEVYYPEHSPEHIEHYSFLVKKYDLVSTGGTDFHGAIKPNIQMGCGQGDFFVPYAVYDQLARRLQSMK